MLGGLFLFGYSYDANGNVLVRAARSYQYDALDRLTQESEGTPISYGYDANGNRLTKAQGAQTTSYAYSAGTNQLTSIDTSALAYDAAGNLTTDEQGRSLTYNNMGRLSEVRDSGATLLATYTYNAQGQRTRKVTPSGTTVYHYDLAGNLISETTETGAPIRDYVWQDATPLAQIEAGSPEALIFLHTDHLQTPRLATNTVGISVWRWEGEAFGNTPPNQDVDGDGEVTIINGRFPGQYFDAETGRHYNWHRYYDSETGRYVRSDPLGLAGGLNSYLYVAANPIGGVDIDGLRPITPGFSPPPQGLGDLQKGLFQNFCSGIAARRASEMESQISAEKLKLAPCEKRYFLKCFELTNFFGKPCITDAFVFFASSPNGAIARAPNNFVSLVCDRGVLVGGSGASCCAQ